jgi:hypothetical protein
LWPADNYDPNQWLGAYITAYAFDMDASYQTVTEDTLVSMIGGQYDVYPYFKPLAVSQFAMDTHDPAFSGRIQMRDWIGGKLFDREVDFLDFFRGLAVKHGQCAKLETCDYDPQQPQTNPADGQHSDKYNEFIGPDSKRYIWAYIPSRNQWVVADRDRNIASYVVIRGWTQDVINQQDDGQYPGTAFSHELQMKYFLDAFKYYD